MSMNKEKKYGLLGEHLTHSFSPLIHSRFGDYPYDLYEVERDELEKWVRSNDLAGYNVTIPYKQEIMKYCHVISEGAEKIGAVNTVVKCQDGTLFGDNTDYYGFSYMLSKLPVDVGGKKALVLGSGGASKTVQTVLSELGAQVVVVSRSGQDNYHNIANHKDAYLLVNTTPVGMYPHCPCSPVDLNVFENLSGVCDVIYNPAKTQLILQAEKLGIPTVSGLPMLVAQAKRAAEIFLMKEIDNSLIEKTEKEIASTTRNIVLVGMPGSGKTTVGKLAAKILGRRFTDSDEEIERVTGTTPSEIIRSKGEGEFRRIETQVLADICKESSLVIATGGGAVTVEDNKDLLRQNSVVVFIDRNTESLATDDRPLSVNLLELYKKRLPMYNSFAHIKVDGNKSADEVAEDVIKAFSEVL